MSTDYIWTDDELAAKWKCDIRLVQKMFREGRLRGFKAGREWRITDAAKSEYEDAQRVTA